MRAPLPPAKYAEVMRDSLASEDDRVGGSERCASAVAHGKCGGVVGFREGVKTNTP